MSKKIEGIASILYPLFWLGGFVFFVVWAIVAPLAFTGLILLYLISCNVVDWNSWVTWMLLGITLIGYPVYLRCLLEKE